MTTGSQRLLDRLGDDADDAFAEQQDAGDEDHALDDEHPGTEAGEIVADVGRTRHFGPHLDPGRLGGVGNGAKQRGSFIEDVSGPPRVEPGRGGTGFGPLAVDLGDEALQQPRGVDARLLETLIDEQRRINRLLRATIYATLGIVAGALVALVLLRAVPL